MSEETRNLLKEVLKPDYKLYNHFKSKFDKAVQDFGKKRMEEEIFGNFFLEFFPNFFLISSELDQANTQITENCGFVKAGSGQLSNGFKWAGKSKIMGYKIEV